MSQQMENDMKKLLIIAAMVACTTANAGPHYAQHGGHRLGWLVPTIIAGAIVYEATRPTPQVIVQQPIYVQPEPVIVQPPVVVQPVPVEPKYVQRIVWDQYCNCYKKVFVQVE